MYMCFPGRVEVCIATSILTEPRAIPNFLAGKVFIQCVYWCTGYVYTLLATCEAGRDVRQGTSEEPEGEIQPSLHSARVSRTP